MKKMVLLLFLCLVVTGCGKVKCTLTGTDGTETISVVGKFSGKYLTQYTTTSTIKTNSKLEAEQMCTLMKSSEVDKSYDVECNNRIITVTHTSKVKKSEKVTKAKFRNSYKKNNFTCK